MSAHYYVDDGEIAYQGAPHSRGCWHVGRNYEVKIYSADMETGTASRLRCVQKGYDYETAFLHTVELVKNLMNETGIPSDAVLPHYDICVENCRPRFRSGETGSGSSVDSETEDGSEKSEYNPGIYRVTDPALNIRRSWRIPGGRIKTRKWWIEKSETKPGQTAVGSRMDQLP